MGPAVFASVAVALLVYDHVQRQVTDVVFWLSLALVAAIFVWLVSKTAVVVARERRRALADELTGLPSALKLMDDLRAALADPDGDRWLLALVSIDGLPGYNDRYGRAAGDELLCDFAASLTETATALGATTYRLGGGGFALLTPLQARLPSAIMAAVAATPLACEEEGLVSDSYADVTIPDEANDSQLAVQVAEQRLAARKHRQRRSARGQLRDVLLAVLAARRPELRKPAPDLAYWILAVGRNLGLDRDQLDDIVLAAELRDIGLLAVPEATLEKQSGLYQRELDLLARHPVAGARILNAAPTLAAIAPIVRATHEHVDGSGYPDGLRGDAIPLGARIIALCAAFSTMLADGRPEIGTVLALGELEGRAGTQFDAGVVDALAAAAGEVTSSAKTRAQDRKTRGPAHAVAP